MTRHERWAVTRCDEQDLQGRGSRRVDSARQREARVCPSVTPPSATAAPARHAERRAALAGTARKNLLT